MAQNGNIHGDHHTSCVCSWRPEAISSIQCTRRNCQRVQVIATFFQLMHVFTSSCGSKSSTNDYAASARGKKRSNIRVISFPQIETWLCISGILAKPKRRGHRAVIYYYYRLPKRLINETSTRVCQIGFSVSPIHRPDAWPI